MGHPLGVPMLVTQLPADTNLQKPASNGRLLRADYGERARIVAILPDGTVQLLTTGFHSATDPAVSFDAARFLFAGKRTAADHWNIHEMAVDGSRTRQVTRNSGNCRSPGYQSSLYTILSDQPWYQITFVSDFAGTSNEAGPTPATHLYSCKLDGSAVRRLTFNVSSDLDPVIMSDGRLLFASWQRSTLDRGYLGRIGLFGINLDGTDYAMFADPRGKPVKHMPCVTARGLAVFVEADRVPYDGAGQLASVEVRRPLHSYRPITRTGDGLFHSPSPLADGRILVSRRPDDGSATHGVYRLDPRSGKADPVFDDPRYHDVQAKAVRPGRVPDGRSSVVNEEDPHGKLYCLDVYTTDFDRPEWMPPGSAVRLRVLEGVPLRTGDRNVDLLDSFPPGSRKLPPERRKPRSTAHGIPPLVPRRLLGEVPIAADGSFNVQVPANTPIQLQLLDADGMAIRSCGWIWARNREPRGCVGCHEDGELTPENWFADSVRADAVSLCPPPDRRCAVDFRRHVAPIVEAKCVGCHGADGAEPRLDERIATDDRSQPARPFSRAYRNLLVAEPFPDASNSSPESDWGRYVHPGRARTSPMIWHVFGRNTSRPWDGVSNDFPVAQIPPGDQPALTGDEKQTLLQWIDTGALWDSTVGVEHPPKKREDEKQ